MLQFLPADDALVDVRAAVLRVALVSLGALCAGLGPRAVAVHLAALVALGAEQLLVVLVRVVVTLAAPASDDRRDLNREGEGRLIWRQS